MEDRYLPSSRTAVHVNTTGAVIVEEDDDEEQQQNNGKQELQPGDDAPKTGCSIHNHDSLDSRRDSRDIYLPKHTEWISHIAVDIGGSLAKVVYFSRALSNSNGQYAAATTDDKGKQRESSTSVTNEHALPTHVTSPRQPRTPLRPAHTPTGGHSRPASPGRLTPVPNGVLGPESIASAAGLKTYFDHYEASQQQQQQQSSASSSPTAASSQHASNSNSTDHPPAGSGNPVTVNGDHHHRRQVSAVSSLSSSIDRSTAHRRTSSSSTPISGGWLNFTKFETGDIESCILYINELIEASSASYSIPSSEFKARYVKIMATGGGAHLYYEQLSRELGVEVRKEEEMECLIAGLTFFMEIPHEVFWYSDELVHAGHNPSTCSYASPNLGAANGFASFDDLPRPSPNPPQFSLVFEDRPSPQFPCMLVNIGSGVSIIKVDDYGKFERISGTSLGGGTLWGLLSLLTGADSFDGELPSSARIITPAISPKLSFSFCP